MAVLWLVLRDVEPAREVVVLVARACRGKSLEQSLEVPKQQRLVLVDRDPERRVQRLNVDPPDPQPRLSDLVAQPVGDVDEFGRVLGLEAQALADHHLASKARRSSSRVWGAGRSEAAADDISSIARANATCTGCGAASASSRDERARQRSPINSVGGGAARPPRPWSRTPTSMSAAASASLG